MIQLSANAVALTLFAAAIGCGRGQNPQAQLALLAGALPISLVGSYHGHLADKADLYQRMRDAAALEAYAGQLAAAIEIPVMPAPMSMPAPMLPAASAPIESESVTYFDWQLIQTKPDKYAHLAIVGGTGDGKSTLVQSLLQFLGEKAIAVDPHWQPGNYPGIPTVAKGRNYGSYPADPIPFEELVRGADCSYTEAIATIHKEMDRRYKLLQQGKPVGDRYSFIFDEYTTFAGTHPKCSGDEVLSLIREARKVGLRLILIVQSDQVKDFKWEGQGAARKSLRWCRLGDFAKEFASASKDERLNQWVEAQAYPILVDKVPAVLPVPIARMRVSSQVVTIENQPHHTVSTSPKSESDVIKNYLDRLYNLPGYSHPEPGSEPTRTSEPLNLPLEPLNLNQNNGFSGSANPAQGSQLAQNLPPEPLNPNLVNRVLALKKEGKNKAEIILALWGAKKGGSQAYRDASDEFEAIKTYWESLGAWG